MTKQVPLAEGLFTWPSEQPALLGGQCPNCGSMVFPIQRYCMRCEPLEEMQQVELPRRGRLWTFTTQQFRPPSPPYAGHDSPETFEPFGVGYVELPGALKVEARLTESDPDKLAIGQEMELRIVPFGVAEDGTETVIYAFAPVS